MSAVVSAQGECAGPAAGAGAAVEPGARRAQQGGVRAAAERAAAARPAVQGRGRPRREARRLLRPQAGGAGVRVLRVPDAVHAGAERPRERAARDRRDRSARNSTSSRSASIRARRRCWRRARRRPTSSATSGPSAEQGWHFLTGEQASIDALTKAAGFSYSWDEAVAAVRARQRHRRGDAGRQAVALFLRHRLLAARREVRADRIVGRARSASLADRLLLYCYHYDPATGNYGFVAMRAVRLGGAVTLAGAGRIHVRVDPARSPRAAGH